MGEQDLGTTGLLDLGTMLVACGCDAQMCPESPPCSSAACSEG